MFKDRQPQFRVLPVGDTAFTVEFPALHGATGARHVRQLRERIEAERECGHLNGLVDLICATRCLTVCIDPAEVDYTTVQQRIEALLQADLAAQTSAGQRWVLPVCYSDSFGEDLPAVAQATGMGKEALITLHSAQVYDVLLIGFLPGFPFMSQVPEVMRLPRRETPRLKVPAGSVAIANEQTAIYPWISPGGWHLLGRCPVPLFDANRERPSLLAPGDRVRFKAIDEDQFFVMERDLAAGAISPNDFKAEAQ